MKKIVILLSLSLIVTYMPHHLVHAQNEFVVVELFTSESCSSCPVADQLLRQLTTLAKEQNKPIYTLGFHVDYWNYLHWVDEYSKPAYSQRQRHYAQRMKGSSVYTPQMIINGTHQFGGYRKDLAKKHIDQALQQPSNFHLSVQANVVEQEIVVSAHVDYLVPHTYLNVALVENNLSNNIASGENAGRYLKHANVVREFRSVALSNPTEIKLPLPADLNKENSTIIAYLQEDGIGQILDAHQTPIQY